MGTPDLRNNGLPHASMSRGVSGRGSEHLVCAYGVNVCASGCGVPRALALPPGTGGCSGKTGGTPRRKEQARWEVRPRATVARTACHSLVISLSWPLEYRDDFTWLARAKPGLFVRISSRPKPLRARLRGDTTAIFFTVGKGWTDDFTHPARTAVLFLRLFAADDLVRLRRRAPRRGAGRISRASPTWYVDPHHRRHLHRGHHHGDRHAARGGPQPDAAARHRVAALMIVLLGMVGLSVMVGARRYRQEQDGLRAWSPSGVGTAWR